MRYLIIIHKDSESDYGVTVPDLPGCFSAGSSFDEALINAKEAIECHIEGLLLDNEEVPSPLPVEFHQSNPNYLDGKWEMVVCEDFNCSLKKFEKIAISD